jgi:hypothetical protein
MHWQRSFLPLGYPQRIGADRDSPYKGFANAAFTMAAS